MLISTPEVIRVGQPANLRVTLEDRDPTGSYGFQLTVAPGEENPFGTGISHTMRRGPGEGDFEPEVVFSVPGRKTLQFTFPTRRNQSPLDPGTVDFDVLPALQAEIPDARVALVSPGPPPSPDEILWSFIRTITNQLRFEEFREYVEPRLTGDNGPEWYGTNAYRRLRRAADDFVAAAADPLRAVAPGGALEHELTEATVRAGIERSYVSSERADLAQPFLRFDADARPGPAEQQERLRRLSTAAAFPLPNVPFVELIWNYWKEELGLVQSMNHILARFQNRRVGPGQDVLARFDLNPLLPLRNLLWGFAEEEERRLTVRRRGAEYMYQYGIQMLGRAVPAPYTVVERRTQFLESFHALLHSCHGFYKERDDKTVDADAFPLLSSLREVHLVLARGAHNQFADLTVAARAEMLTTEWLFAQPEFREFLGGPTMVPYEEDWMDRVQTMRTLMRWSDTSVTHFFELAVHGEQILLSIRHGRWNESGRTREDAANWALTWRNEIQRYVHAYRVVTGVDLGTTVDATMPSVLLARRVDRRIRRA